MNSRSRKIFSNMDVVFIILIAGMLKPTSQCSPDPNKPPRSVTELTILAPVVVVAKVLNISVPSSQQMFTEYAACFNVEEVIKDSRFPISQRFCTKEFGTEAMCLSHVFPGNSYVLHLNADLKARYDSHFSAAYPASDITLRLARRGFCNSSTASDSSCVPPVITEVQKDFVSVKEGKTLLLTCNASGTKPYVVMWYFNGKINPVPSSAVVKYDGSLFFGAITPGCQGRYTCVVKNAAGMTSRNQRVIVESKHCGDFVMVNKRSNVYSPNFPGEYAPDKSCAWRFCPPSKKRIKFLFNVFQLERSDAIIIDNECDNSQEPWRKYCGARSPGEFVSNCESGCVQLRLLSKLKMESYRPFLGMNITVEPTNETRTPKIDVLKQYCTSDFVLKGRFVKREYWPLNSIKIFALETFKKPFKCNITYTVVYSDEDSYGCYEYLDFVKDHYFLGIIEDGLLSVKTAIPDDTQRRAFIYKTSLEKYKDMDSVCRPPQ